MKYANHLIAAGFAMIVNSAAYADNADNCYWSPQLSDKTKRYFTLTPTPSRILYLAPIGGRMNYQALSLSASSGKINLLKCPTKVTNVTYSLSIDAPLEDGYDKVYRTNIPGVGLRLVDDNNGKTPLPYESSYTNAVRLAKSLPEPLTLELVRTSRDVKTGTLNINMKIMVRIHDWDAAEISIVGPIELTSSNYFSGCTGEKSQDIPLGKVAIPLLEQQVPHTIGLNVLCTGLLPGSKLPVRVYFEGSNEGSGMLNLTPGGAEGVGVALTTPAGVKLPFAKWSGIAMQWVRTEEGGERYTFEFNAKYARKGSAKITPGRADAVLNYILDYN
ncbi:fimbrial protein [Pseudomonas palleroniana]